MRTRRLQRLGAGAGAALLACLALGCPQGADLEPGNYTKPGYVTSGTTTGGSSTGGSAAGGADTSACDTACIKAMFQTDPTGCSLCHGVPGGLMSSMLDLKSDGFTARLKDVPAKHGDITAPMTNANCPKGDKLIDTSTPSASWLLKKIEGMQGDCGTSMPSTGTLNTMQKTCMETYISCVAGGSITGGGGTATGGGATTGGGGPGGAATGGGGTAAGGGGTSAGGSGGRGSGGTGGA